MTDRKQTVMRVLRERAGISQTQLARMLGRKQPEVSMWEWAKEPMAMHVRYQVLGVLRSAIAESYPLLTVDDLTRPWDDVVLEWARHTGAPTTS